MIRKSLLLPLPPKSVTLICIFKGQNPHWLDKIMVLNHLISIFYALQDEIYVCE